MNKKDTQKFNELSQRRKNIKATLHGFYSQNPLRQRANRKQIKNLEAQQREIETELNAMRGTV